MQENHLKELIRDIGKNVLHELNPEDLMTVELDSLQQIEIRARIHSTVPDLAERMGSIGEFTTLTVLLEALDD